MFPLARDEGSLPDTAAQLWPDLTAFPCLLIGLTRFGPGAGHAKERNSVLSGAAGSVNDLAKKSSKVVNRPMRNFHAWTHRTEEGEKREVRAVKNQGRWRLQSKVKQDEEWTYHEVP